MDTAELGAIIEALGTLGLSAWPIRRPCAPRPIGSRREVHQLPLAPPLIAAVRREQ